VLQGVGWLDSAGRFAYTSVPGRTACDEFTANVSGTVPLPSAAGAFPDRPAIIQWQWLNPLVQDCGIDVRVGPLQLDRDPASM
jgi:hypothetical protein